MPTEPNADEPGPYASPPCFLHELDETFRGFPTAEPSPEAPPSELQVEQQPPRLLPRRLFPPYAYLPGRFPHPIRDPKGHSYSPAEETSAAETPIDPDAMSWGMDLFNHGYYWEAHEAWEALWRATPKGTPERDLLHGLILLAAAGVKLREGKLAAACKHGSRAASFFRAADCAADDRNGLLGIALSGLAEKAENTARSPARGPNAAVVFDFELGSSSLPSGR
jgi:hypothetical protein